MIALVCPGQGSQTPGFLLPWLEVEEFAQLFYRFEDGVGLPLAKLGTEGTADQIRDTSVAQPLIVGASIASMHALLGDSAKELGVSLVAGHSVGEVAAAAIAGILQVDEAARLVRVRGDAMATAAAEQDSSMAAVLGGDAEQILADLAKRGLTAANHNGAGQIVAAGASADIANLVAEPPAGTRVVQLQVAGAFHTGFMASAVASLESFAAELTPRDPELAILSNQAGQTVDTGAAYLRLLVAQVSNPVRWDLCMAKMLELGVTAVLELAPAGTLVGLAKRAMAGVETFALKSPEQIEDARDLIRRHRG